MTSGYRGAYRLWGGPGGEFDEGFGSLSIVRAKGAVKGRAGAILAQAIREPNRYPVPAVGCRRFGLPCGVEDRSASPSDAGRK